MLIDPPWPFETYSERSAHAVTEHYDTMRIEEIKALPVAQLAAKDCAIFCWVTWPNMPHWYPDLKAWGVAYSGLGFDWVKQNPSGDGLHWGNGSGRSEKPEEAHRRIEGLYAARYLELFARRPRDGWTTWGNEFGSVNSRQWRRERCC
jgi:N6-adenosine-specific RNA methylase IME4